ncbi:SDR family oxidoreductase [Saccharopolyspora mangrovi]|uniref:DUF1731 domain-containing protein n=1 Tax=Saccharopolyspora mangrovi TaxID=3082379 RepID=A0ABU6AC37_9PSEU|nr:DUF1731 domain-containing protein [Saccharopolyspora sp. S2-29]MEB3369086.1 DUF1731 domain-containing protein [Saccharopolyspora sp. S2-29]
MAVRFSSVVEGSVEEVFAWHSRPGAISRLTPPWQPVRVRAEAASLRDGTAVLGLPGGLRWVASHRPNGYAPPHRFVDELTSLPLSAVLSWRHTHEFSPAGGTTTRVTDAVETALPRSALRAMFTYRHAQLADDLASHARARSWRSSPVTVALTGSAGLVGTALAALLSTGGHRVIRLNPHPARQPDERHWNPADPAPELLTGVDVVVHLASDPVGSGARPTLLLARRAATTAGGPSAFVAASDVGYYGREQGEEVLTEAGPRGDGALADAVAARESATAPAAEAGLRAVVVRTGIVQSPRGGALKRLFPLFSAGLGGSLGEGRRWLPWIGLDDLADVHLRAVLDAGLSGPVNAVAPEPVRLDDYARTLARVLARPALLPSPLAGLVLGGREAAADQRVEPDRLRRAGHHFRHPDLDAALRHVLGRA